MTEEIDITSLDLRFEGLRIKNPAAERRLLSSIAQRGIEQPLQGFDLHGQRVLLEGFKRYRCARKLHLHTVPFTSLAEDEVGAILKLLRRSASKSLGLIEQAAFLDELRKVRGMALAQIAQDLSVSTGWVSMRLRLIDQMSPTVRQKVFNGSFPLYAYMYTVRPFMRMNGQNRQQIDQFVGALSGHRLSLRDIEQLAHGFFRGPESFREQILKGNLTLLLERCQQAPADPEACSEFERVFLNDLELLHKSMRRVMGKSQHPRLKSPAFLVQAHLLTAALLSGSTAFYQTLRGLHDRCGKA